MKQVNIISSGYEWTCPECEEFNREIEITETVECPECREKFTTGEPMHAYK